MDLFYKLENGSSVDATSYHPIYTQEGWKSYTNHNGYPSPEIGDMVKTPEGWSKLVEITYYEKEPELTYNLDVTDLNVNDGYDNFYAGGMLVENGSPCPV